MQDRITNLENLMELYANFAEQMVDPKLDWMHPKDA